MNRQRCGEGHAVPTKCLPFFHDYEVKEGPRGHGHRTVQCTKCNFEKIQKHFGRGVWL